MGNLLPSLAAHLDRPYSQQQQDIWVAILIRLRAILARSDGDNYDAMTLPLQLRSRLRLGLTNSTINADTLAFFDDASDFGRDLNAMLSFLAHISFQFRVEEDRRRQQRAARRAAMSQVTTAALVRATFGGALALAIPNGPHQIYWNPANANKSRAHLSILPRMPIPLTPKLIDEEVAKQALQLSGLLPCDSYSLPDSRFFLKFGMPLAQYELRMVGRATRRFMECLMSNPELKEGKAALTKTKELKTYFIVAGNAIPALAKAEGRAYTQAQQKQWQAIVNSVWVAMNSFNGIPRPSYDLPDDLHKLAVQHLTEREDLELFLNFVAYVSAALYAEHQEIKEKVREQQIKRGGKLLNPCGNEPMKEAERREAMDKL
ncbi:hypothetical protein D0867_14896 [Hortaea werneckii]|uniref:Uncharacterized protein n=1 Tax=Hortaea werneckii TaxID=91943 RepID=A0A3M6XLD1_HORWE|nr:hypothetical protein D0867_14896 [Hortaea werneckii]